MLAQLCTQVAREQADVIAVTGDLDRDIGTGGGHDLDGPLAVPGGEVHGPAGILDQVAAEVLGEGIEDLRPFDADEFVKALFE